MSAETAAADHRFQLGPLRWSMWRLGVLRSSGFPSAGVDDLAAPGLAATADDHLAGTTDEAAFLSSYRAARRSASAAVMRIASERSVREAATWQQSETRDDVDRLATGTFATPAERAALETSFARQWQRYCTSNDTVGFFGPFVWCRLDPDRPDTVAPPGRAYLSRRKVFLEPWALAALGRSLASDPAVRAWMPPAPRPHHHLQGEVVHSVDGSESKLTEHEAAVLRLCNGLRPGREIADQLGTTEAFAAGGAEQVLAVLQGLVDRRLVTWDANLPVGMETDGVLRRRIAAIGDPEVRSTATTALRRLETARDRVACAAGDPDALDVRLKELDATFTELTGAPPRRTGFRYPGHAVCWEDAIRMMRPSVGNDILQRVAPGLEVALEAARWATADLARVFQDAMRHVIGRHEGEATPTLADIWDDGAHLLLDTGPAGLRAQVYDAFQERWRALCEHDGGAHVRLDAAALRERLPRCFPAERPGWSWARVHSPDILVAADSLDAVRRGAFVAVLGELHVAFATHCNKTLSWALPDMDEHFRCGIEDFGRPRWLPLIPRRWSDFAQRAIQFDHDPSDRVLGFAPAAPVEGSQVTSAREIRIGRSTTGLHGSLPDGEKVPLVEFFAAFLSIAIANVVRDSERGAHSPRISIGDLVVARESWQLSADDVSGLTADGPARYLAARRVVVRHGLPRRCFVRVDERRKPFYVDFTSPTYLDLLATALRGQPVDARNAEVRVTEMLPTPEQAWLQDAAGQSYISEFRLQVTDPRSAHDEVAR